MADNYSDPKKVVTELLSGDEQRIFNVLSQVVFGGITYDDKINAIVVPTYNSATSNFGLSLQSNKKGVPVATFEYKPTNKADYTLRRVQPVNCVYLPRQQIGAINANGYVNLKNVCSTLPDFRGKDGLDKGVIMITPYLKGACVCWECKPRVDLLKTLQLDTCIGGAVE
jgi:hypothetical protein